MADYIVFYFLVITEIVGLISSIETCSHVLYFMAVSSAILHIHIKSVINSHCMKIRHLPLTTGKRNTSISHYSSGKWGYLGRLRKKVNIFFSPEK